MKYIIDIPEIYKKFNALSENYRIFLQKLREYMMKIHRLLEKRKQDGFISTRRFRRGTDDHTVAVKHYARFFAQTAFRVIDLAKIMHHVPLFGMELVIEVVKTLSDQRACRAFICSIGHVHVDHTILHEARIQPLFIG